MVKIPLSLLFIIRVCKPIYFVSLKLRHHQDCWISIIWFYIKTGRVQTWKNFNPLGFLKKNRLQLLATFVSVHSFMLSVHLLDPKFLSYSQEHGVLVPNLLEDGHGPCDPGHWSEPRQLFPGWAQSCRLSPSRWPCAGTSLSWTPTLSSHNIVSGISA